MAILGPFLNETPTVPRWTFRHFGVRFGFFFSNQTHIHGAKKGFHGKVRRAADHRHYCNQLIEKVSRLVSDVETAHVCMVAMERWLF